MVACLLVGTEEWPGLGVMYQMRPDGESAALFRANVPHISAIRNVNHAEPEHGYALPVCIFNLK
jgi:hypothetical protein